MPTDFSADLAPVPLDESDVEQCAALSSAAGWNQTALDWMFILRSGEAIGLKTDTGRVVATGVSLPAAPGVAWIAMVLVDEHFRRKGLGRRVTASLLSGSTQACFALDATEPGRLLYESLGFRAFEKIVRHRIRREGGRPSSYERAGTRETENRRFAGIWRELSNRADIWTTRCGSALGCIRPGRIALQIGPLTSDSEADAADLIRSLLDETEGDVFVDVPFRLATFTKRLERFGFSADRTFVRMARGGSCLVDPGVFAIAGPEYG